MDLDAGDISVDHNDKFHRTSIVDKLLTISETFDQLPTLITRNDTITGWQPFYYQDHTLAPKKSKTIKLTNTSNEKKISAQVHYKENSKEKKHIFLKDIRPLRLKTIPNPFQDINSKRAIKIGMRRLEELATPKNIRKKVELESYKRHEMPVKRTVSLDSSLATTPDEIGLTKENCFASTLKSEKEEIILFQKFLRKIPKLEKQLLSDPSLLETLTNQSKKTMRQNDISHIALHYGICGAEFRKKKRSISNKSSKKQFTPVRTPREHFTKKFQGLYVHKETNADLTPVLPQKQQNSSGSVTVKASLNKRTRRKDNSDLPMPHANLTHFKHDKITHSKSQKLEKDIQQLFNWRFTALHPNNYNSNKTTAGNKNKKSLGSVTAITEGKVKAGINTHSIGKLQRQPIPGEIDQPIIPKLTGNHAEAPLLSFSPDFLKKFA